MNTEIHIPEIPCNKENIEFLLKDLRNRYQSSLTISI